MLKLSVRPVRLFGPLLAALAIWGQAAASSKYALIAEPPIAHPGDTIYLSGSGYPPNTPLTIISVCNDTTQSPKKRMTVGAAGPTTDKSGRLIASRFQLPHFPGGNPLTCRYYPLFSTQGKDAVSPAMQKIAPEGTAIDPANNDPTITFWLTRSHATWTLHLSSWPGAQLRAEVRYSPSQQAQHIFRTLGWRGRVSLTVPKNAFVNGNGPSPSISIFASSVFAGHIGSIATCERVKRSTGALFGNCS